MVRASAVAALLMASGTAQAEAPRHMGVASCSSTVCHGAVTPVHGSKVLLNEYVTWSHQDAHAKAYATLSSERSRAIAAKLGLHDASAARVCLDCHADNVAPEERGERFALSDGIGCEACHGGAEHWLSTHSSKGSSYRDNVAHGMYPTADLRQRAQLCLSCHYGAADKFATHRIMAAGHPRLSFELDTFLTLEPPHYEVDEDYRQRKPSYSHTQVWVYGQLAATLTELETLQGPRIDNSATFPELALFDCFACHMSSMHRTDWNRGMLGTAAQPGTVPVSGGHLSMAYIIARQLDPNAAPELLKSSQALIAASASGREHIAASSRELAQQVRALRERAVGHSWSRAEQLQLLGLLLQTGVNGEFRDYTLAEQALMGIDGLLIELKLAEAHRTRLDELYRLVQNDERYLPEQFVAALRQLQSELQSSLAP
jgi:Cytochrome c554 and c-prime